MFQHANIKTPHWLGYLIIRPESHTLHHQRGVHRHNYCDLPLWDMIFGTFRNPRYWEGEAGFYDGASRRIGAMLIGKERSEEHTSELQSLMRISYAVFCLKKKTHKHTQNGQIHKKGSQQKDNK